MPKWSNGSSVASGETVEQWRKAERKFHTPSAAMFAPDRFVASCANRAGKLRCSFLGLFPNPQFVLLDCAAKRVFLRFLGN